MSTSKSRGNAASKLSWQLGTENRQLVFASDFVQWRKARVLASESSAPARFPELEFRSENDQPFSAQWTILSKVYAPRPYDLLASAQSMRPALRRPLLHRRPEHAHLLPRDLPVTHRQGGKGSLLSPRRSRRGSRIPPLPPLPSRKLTRNSGLDGNLHH